MTRGQTGALNYAIPLNQQPLYQPPATQQMRPQGETFELPDDLAVVQDKTSKLFNNYGLLQNFIKSMRDQGIDPFTPDYSQDGGGLPYQTLLELDAGVRYAAQELKNEQEYRKQTNPFILANKAGYAPGVNPQTDMLSQNPNSIVSYEELPFVQNANQRLNTPTYTQGDQNRFNQAYYNPTLAQIDQLVQSGQLSPQEAAIQKANLQQNVAQTAYQQLIDRGGRGGLSQEDISRRAELIKKFKQGIVSNDPTPLNLLRLVPNVEEAAYVNTGDRVGIEVYFRNQDTPAFIDLSKGGGEADINALINRIEGQMNVKNEDVLTFDTSVSIPASNARKIIDDVKNKLSSLPNSSEIGLEVIPKLQELATGGLLFLPSGEQVVSINSNIPWWGANQLIVEYYKTDPKTGRATNTITKKKISTPEELKAFVEENANEIAPAFGGGFEQPESNQPGWSVLNNPTDLNNSPNPLRPTQVKPEIDPDI